MAHGYETLTERERHTLRLLLTGHDAKSIARHLGLSVHTVNERLREARRKLCVSMPPIPPAHPIATPAGGFIGPVKRSITIAGHATSISLEPPFWAALESAATVRALPLSALVAEIDALRIVAADPPNLASALRTWLFSNRE